MILYSLYFLGSYHLVCSHLLPTSQPLTAWRKPGLSASLVSRKYNHSQSKRTKGAIPDISISKWALELLAAQSRCLILKKCPLVFVECQPGKTKIMCFCYKNRLKRMGENPGSWLPNQPKITAAVEQEGGGAMLERGHGGPAGKLWAQEQGQLCWFPSQHPEQAPLSLVTWGGLEQHHTGSLFSGPGAASDCAAQMMLIPTSVGQGQSHLSGTGHF